MVVLSPLMLDFILLLSLDSLAYLQGLPDWILTFVFSFAFPRLWAAFCSDFSKFICCSALIVS
jgi:hypothetical protein